MTDFATVNPPSAAPSSFKDQKNEVAYWEAEYKKCDALRKQFEEQWYYNLAFYFSKQWVIWQRTSNSSRLVDPATPRNRVRLTVNKIKPIVRDELTKLIKEEPQFFVEPNTTSPKDVAAARVAESVAEFILHQRKFNRVRRQATFWSLITGTGYIKASCSGPDKEIDLASIPTFHIFVPDLDTQDIQDQPYVMHCRGLAKETLEEKYQIKLAPDMAVNGPSLEQKFLNALGIKNREGEGTVNLVYTKEIWVKPCSKYPQGALLVIANNQLVYRYSPDAQVDDNGMPVGGTDTFAFEHGEYPFSKFDHTPTGRYYGESTIVDCIPLQKEYNRTRSQILESKNRMAKPQMSYVKGSVDVNKITSEVGLYIPVQPGFDPPKPIDIKPLPDYVLMEVDRIKQDMDEIAGISEISRGSVPTGIEAASAIAYLKEENDSKIYNTVASIEEATEDVGRQVLNLVQQFWTQEKIVSVVSRNNFYESQLFIMSGLEGNTNLRVEVGSMAPKSMAARQAFIVDLMDKGIIPPEKGLRYLQMNETNRLYDELMVDAKQAQRENFKMTQGEQVATNPWDNHETHVYEHKLYMKSQEFEMLDDGIRNIFIAHLTMHEMTVAQNVYAGQPQPGDAGSNNSSIPADNVSAAGIPG